MEYVMWMWLAAVLVLIAIELLTTSLTTIWFAGGALVGFLLNICGAPLWAQIAAFIVVSLLLLIFTRPVLTKAIKKSGIRTNVDSLVGTMAKVTEQINNREGTGTAIVNGQEWTARSIDDAVTIESGETVEIVEISGVKIIVKKNESEG